MALIPLASQGNFLHIYDFHVDPDHIDDFVKLFFFHGPQHDASIAFDQVRRVGLDVLTHRNPLHAAEGFLAFA